MFTSYPTPDGEEVLAGPADRVAVLGGQVRGDRFEHHVVAGARHRHAAHPGPSRTVGAVPQPDLRRGRQAQAGDLGARCAQTAQGREDAVVERQTRLDE